MKPIHDPFSRDAHPDLTAEILKVVNESHSRGALEKMGVAQLRELKKKYDARVAKGDRDASRTLANIHGLLRAKGGGHALDEAASTGGGKKPFNPFNPTLGDLLKSKQQNEKNKKADKSKPVKEAVTPAQKKVFARERERMHTALNDPNKKLAPTEREAVIARGQRSAAAEARKGAVSPTGVKGPEHAQAVRYHNYARKESKKLDAILKRKAVKEGAQLDERIVDEMDFFQASKNWIKGKGFKTNREVGYDRVKKNYEAMKARQAAEAKGKGKTK